MQGNNALVGFALLIAVTVCAALMPWGAFHVAVDTPFIEGASLPVSVEAFGGHLTLLGLIIPNWLATLLIVSSAVLGMTNAKGITTFPRSVVLAPLLIAAVHCLLIVLLLIRSEAVPRLILEDMEQLSHMERDRSVLGAGLILTLLAAVCGAFMAVPTAGPTLRGCIAPKRSQLWIALTCYHFAAASYLFLIPCRLWGSPQVPMQEVVDTEPSLWLGIALPFLVGAGLTALIAYGLHRRNRRVWVVSLALSLFLLPPPFISLADFFRVPLPLFFILGQVAFVCVYWGLLPPGTRAEFRRDRNREDPTPE